MRTVYLVTYDICDDRRLRDVYKAMRGAGDHIQYSVFRCELSPKELVEMTARLEVLIDHREDQVLVVDLGPPDGRVATSIRAIGRAYTPLLRRATII
jgi:CRISPR-associated protein Cas2